MNFPTLFKLDQNGKVRQWTIKVSGNSYHMESGVVGGAITVSKPTYSKAKNVGRSNATTAEEQAQLDAKRRWDSRVENGAVTDIETAKKGVDLPFFKPMLANGYNQKKIEFPMWSQPKLDGIRCIVRLEDGVIVARSRNGKVIDCVEHIKKSTKLVFDEYPNAILDGELYNHDLKDNFNKITSLVRKQRPTNPEKIKQFEETALVEAKDTIQYWVYDVLTNETHTFLERKKTLGFMVKIMTNSTSVVLVPTIKVNSFEELDELYGSYLSEGYEGQILRKDSVYESKRTHSLLKRKEFQDGEYLVVGMQEGDGNRTGTAKNLICQCEKTGKQFSSNIKASWERLTEMLKNRDQIIGKKATIQYFNLTPDGIPRFPYAIEIRDYE